MTVSKEGCHLEFKEARDQYDTSKLYRYCVGLANEGGGMLILGVTDKIPRRVVGCQAFRDPAGIANKIFNKLGFRVDAEALTHPDGRVLIFHIPGRPTGSAYHLDGNERLARQMRAIGVCEQKGSGIDKVIYTVEVFQLPAPDFRTSTIRTTVVLFAHQKFQDMSKSDRIRSCYQHCCLQCVMNEKMTNQSLRKRFGDNPSKSTVSKLIADTIESGLIKKVAESRKYAHYWPYWQ